MEKGQSPSPLPGHDSNVDHPYPKYGVLPLDHRAKILVIVAQTGFEPALSAVKERWPAN